MCAPLTVSAHILNITGVGGKLQLPQSTLILNMSGLFEENLFMKNCGIALERGNS